MTAAVAPAKKRGRPASVPTVQASDFVLISPDEAPITDYDFRARTAGRSSPYDDALLSLKAAQDCGVPKLLMVKKPRARSSIVKRAKKLSLKVEFAQHRDQLYVRLAPKPDPREVVVAALSDGSKSLNEITKALDAAGLEDVVAAKLVSDMVADRTIVRGKDGALNKWSLVAIAGGAK